MASENTIIIDVEVNASDVAKNLAQVKNDIATLKAENQDYQKQLRKGIPLTQEQAKAYAENSQQIKDLTAQEKMYTAQLNVTTQGNTKLGDSYIEMSRTLAALKQEYRGLSAEQRNSEGGKELLANIQELDKKMKDADATMGDFQRNVGDYRGALAGLDGNVAKLVTLFQGGFKNGLQAAGQSLKAFGKSILATPIGWIIAGIKAATLIFEKLREAFQRNDDASTKMAAALAKLKPIVTFIRNLFNGLADGIATVVDWAGKLVTAIASLNPKWAAASKATEEYVTAQDKLEDTEREYMVAHAEREKERAELEDKARNDRELTAEQRVELLKQSKQLAEDDLADAKRIAEEKYRLLQQEARQNADNSDEMKNRLAEAKAAMLDTQREYVEGTRRLNRQLKSSLDEIDKEQEEKKRAAQQRWKEVQQARKEAAKTELDELRKLEDMTIAAIADATEREVKQVEAGYSRQIQDLQTRLKEEKNLTMKAKEAITGQIVMLEEQRQKDIAAIREAATKEALDREIAAARAEIDAKNAMMEEGIAKEEAIENTRSANAIADLQTRLNTEKDLTISEQNAINAQIEALTEEHERNLAAIREKYLQQEWQTALLDRSNELETQLLKAGENAVKQAQAQLAAAQLENETLLNMDKATKDAMYQTEEEYTAAVLASERQIYEAKKTNEEALKQQVNEIGSTMQAVTGALSSLFEAAAEDSEAYEKFKKAMAIVDAMISMATTIAAATTASTQGDPYTMAIRIAANVAAVTAQFAAVIKAIKAATIPSAGSFAEGGIVPGNSYTGDRMVAHTNSGEMILTRQMQLEMLKLLANGVPSSAFNYNRMKEAFTEALQEQKAPVLVYSEFEDFNNRRKKIQAITEL